MAARRYTHREFTEDHSDRLKLFGGEIKMIRKAKGLLLKELADVVQVESKHLSRIEKGEVDMRLSLFFDIVTALKISPAKCLWPYIPQSMLDDEEIFE